MLPHSFGGQEPLGRGISWTCYGAFLNVLTANPSLNFRIDYVHPVSSNRGRTSIAGPQLDDVLAIADLRHCPTMQTYLSRFTPVTMFVETTGKMLLASSFHCCSVRMF